jgi:hypothetical protein
MRSLDFDAMNCARNAEFQDDPIVPGATPAFCFPAVPHIFCTIGHQQVARRAVKLIAGDDDASAVFHGDQIDFSAR